MDGELLKQLTEKRDEIRRRPSESGNKSLVCTDAALWELARLRPKTKKELTYVSGLGKTFEQKYGDEFMEILGEYHRQRMSASEVMVPYVRETLKNLENRLVNINRRNRLLYMPKLSPRYGVDLVVSEEAGNLSGFKIVEFLKKQERGAKIKVLDMSVGDAVENEKRFGEFKTLDRESQRIKRESGESTLYVGYPFIQGKMVGEDFTVRAPLALFPCTLAVTPESVCLELETDKDVVFNSALVLTHFKFTGKNAAVENNVVEEVRQYKFLDDVIEYFASYGLQMEKKPGSGIKKFVSYTAAKFPKYREGQFELVENAVVGRFSLYSDALQQDFRALIESDTVNEILGDLLCSPEERDIYSDSESAGDSADITPPSERGLNYINDLNSSQESAIINIDKTDRLVLQGPPGTGKSQVITSMIADCVNEGGNVLMVSQKKAALDVIYSRLGNLSRYAVMIGDVKDKEVFYESLAKVFACSEKTKFDESKFNAASDRIEQRLAHLENIAEKMFYDSSCGAPLSRIYDDNFESPFKKADADRLKVFASNICKQLSELGYDSIVEICEWFCDDLLLQTCLDRYALSEKYPWLAQTVSDLSGMQVTGALKEIDGAVDEYVSFAGKGLFGRLFGGGKYRKALKPILKKYFTSTDGKLPKRFFKDPTELYNGFKEYERMRSLESACEHLSAAQKLYFGCVYNIHVQTGEPVKKLCRDLRDYIAYRYITEFESNNREVLGALETFDITVRDVCNLLAVKKDECRERFKSVLSENFADNISAGKRKGEMLRIMDGKRKWSVSRFVNKFGFELFKGLKIWLMTPEAVSELLPLENGLFSLVIFDEASQIYIERGVPAIARAKKVVIAGDHKQLRPSSLGDGRLEIEESDEDTDAALEEESLLDLARFRFPEVLLDYHYRSKYEELIAFSNYAFYKGRLNISPNTSRPAQPPISVKKVEDGLWEDRRNFAEARAVVALLKKYLSDKERKETIGVITFNSSQRDLVRDMLDKESVKDRRFGTALKEEENRTQNGEDVGLFVKNIENVQGDERDVIIFSTAYAKTANGKMIRNFGWLNQNGGENRLNVAVSRAKRKIHIITSITPDQLKTDDLKNEGPYIFKKYLEYAYAVSNGDTDGAKAVLESFARSDNTQDEKGNAVFADKVCAALENEGLEIERNVGMGRYKVDLAVKGDGGKYLLGIECDDGLYERLPNARERDIHRLRYLALRGWKIYRVWSQKWWHDEKGQIARILAAVEERKNASL